MTEGRHYPDDIERIRAQANKLHAMLTDYTAGVEPSLLWQCIWFTEFERVHWLSDNHKAMLQEMREQVASACGISMPP